MSVCVGRRENPQVSYEKQIAIIDKMMDRVIDYCKAS